MFFLCKMCRMEGGEFILVIFIIKGCDALLFDSIKHSYLGELIWLLKV